jgi:hypothetical protein
MTGGPLNSQITNDGRFYTWKDERFLSVTNVLDKAMSKPALIPWSNKLTAEQARTTLDYALAHGEEPELPLMPPKKDGSQPKDRQGNLKRIPNWETDWKREHTRVKNASADRGTIIHDWAEQWVLGREPEPPEEYVAECLGIMRCFDKYGIEPIAAEATVYNRAYHYAGTGDLFAKVGAWGDVVAMLDYKTGNNAWPETAYQLAAYRHGEFLGLPDGSEAPVPETEAGGVLHVDHGTTHLIPYRCGEREFEVFGHMVAVAYEVVGEMKNVKDWAAIRS